MADPNLKITPAVADQHPPIGPTIGDPEAGDPAGEEGVADPVEEGGKPPEGEPS